MTIRKFFSYIALLGNILYILWILYNGIDEGFKDIASAQAVVLIGLVFLLTLNIILLCLPPRPAPAKFPK